MNYLITGGSGFIGQNFIKTLNANDSITILSRKKNTSQNKYQIINDLSEIDNNYKIDCIINLAGKPIDCIWNEKNKHKLITSRTDTTKKLITLIKRLNHKPQIIISASAIGFYGDHTDQYIDETSKPKRSFTHELCKIWEQEILKAETLGVRVCIARLGVVLGKNGGFIKKTITPFKLGLGGKISNGQQIFAWIHIEDVINGFKFLIKNSKTKGTYNFVAPKCCTNEEYTKTISNTLKKPAILHIPAKAIILIFGKMGEALMLKGNNIKPKNLLESGYEFKYTNIKSALTAILK